MKTRRFRRRERSGGVYRTGQETRRGMTASVASSIILLAIVGAIIFFGHVSDLLVATAANAVRSPSSQLKIVLPDNDVRGHEKVPTGGQIEVPTYGHGEVPILGQVEVPAPR